MPTKEAEIEYLGYQIKIQITKSEAGTYTAKALVQTPGQNIEMVFPQAGKSGAAFSPHGKKGQYLLKNPYHAVIEAAQGLIDGRCELMSNLSHPDENTRKAVKEHLHKLMAEEAQNMNFKPKTNATPEQIEAMKTETESLFEKFSVSGVAHLAGQDISVAQRWKSRGRVSATWAHKLCEIEVIKNAGFTREMLRPDVKSWVQMDYPKAG